MDEVFVMGKFSRYVAFCPKCGQPVMNAKESTPGEHRLYDASGIGMTVIGVILLFLGFSLESDANVLLRVFGFIFFLGGLFLWRAPYTI